MNPNLLDEPLFTPHNGLKVGDKVWMATSIRDMTLRGTVIGLDHVQDDRVEVEITSTGERMNVLADWCNKEDGDSDEVVAIEN